MTASENNNDLDALWQHKNERHNVMIGSRIGRWTVLAIEIKKWIKYALCRCDCGNVKLVNMQSLKRGISLSCGCFNRQVIVKNRTIHGFNTRKESHWIYRRWTSMMGRCYNTSNSKYKNYGGRGIVVCEQWHNFNNFLNDMRIPVKGLTLDRINVDGNYELANCRWITCKEQSRNKTNNRNIVFNGDSKCLSEWAEIYGIKCATLWARLKMGWTIERALNTNVKQLGAV